MDAPDLISLFAAPLTEAKIPYIIVGSVASSHFGEPRFTADIDLALTLSAAHARRLPEIFPHPEFYCPPEDVLLVEIKRQERAHFNIIHIPSGLKADLYPCKNQPLFRWAIANPKIAILGNRPTPFAPPEYVILWKLIFYREGRSEKHLRDIATILATQSPTLDQKTLQSAIADHHLETEWSAAQSEHLR